MSIHTTSSTRSVLTPVASRWVRRVALVSALSPVPSSLWRLPLIVGASMGLPTEAVDDMAADPFWLLAGYIIGLGVISDGCAYLTLGLVRPWGETFPRWMPLVGGQPVPTWFAASLGAVGGIGATAFALQLAVTWNSQMNDWDAWAWLMTACYAPLLLWGPSVLVVTTDFVRRRRLRTTSL